MKRYVFIFILFVAQNSFAEFDGEACINIKNDNTRLACYDREFKKTDKIKNSDKTQPAQKKIDKDLQKNQNKEAKEDQLKLFELQSRVKKLEADSNRVSANNKLKISGALKSSIVSTSRSRSGITKFELSDGQTWQSESTITKARENMFKSKKKVRIEKTRFGGFWMIEPSSKSKIKVKRVSK